MHHSNCTTSMADHVSTSVSFVGFVCCYCVLFVDFASSDHIIQFISDCRVTEAVLKACPFSQYEGANRSC